MVIFFEFLIYMLLNMKSTPLRERKREMGDGRRATWRLGDGRLGDLATWRLGDWATWRLGDWAPGMGD